jgi:putative ABC transport system permease protein
MLTVSIRDLLWRRRSFAVALVGTSVVLGLALVLAGVNASFPNEAGRTVAATHAEAWVVPTGTEGPFMSSATLPAALATAFGPGNGGAGAPIAILRGTLERDGHPHDVNVLGVQPGLFTDPTVTDGRPAQRAGEATVDARLSIPVGATVSLSGHSFRVVGLTHGLSYRAGVPTVYTTLNEAQAVAYGGRPLAAAVATRTTPRRLPPGVVVRSNHEVRADLLAPLVNARKTISLVLALLWLVAAIVIGSVVYLSALERVSDFAVYKALGATNGTLIGGVVFQGVLLAATACLVGMAISGVLSGAMPMRAEIAGSNYVALGAIALAMGCIASLSAVRRVLRVDPAIAFAGA